MKRSAFGDWLAKVDWLKVWKIVKKILSYLLKLLGKSKT